MNPFRLSRIAKLGIASCALIASSVVLAQSDSSQNANKPAMEVKVKDLNKNPGKFAGEQVIVTGKVIRLEGPGAFIVEGSGFFNNKILAVVESKQKPGTSAQQPGSVAPVIKEKQKLQLTGKVEELGVTKIEQTYTPLKSEIKEEFEGNMPVLIVPPSGIKTMS